MTWEDNQLKAKKDLREGSTITRHKKVTAYRKDGILHKEYVSVRAAARDVNGFHGAISDVAGNKPKYKKSTGKFNIPKTHKGFIWKWTTLKT